MADAYVIAAARDGGWTVETLSPPKVIFAGKRQDCLSYLHRSMAADDTANGTGAPDFDPRALAAQALGRADPADPHLVAEGDELAPDAVRGQS